MSPKMSNLEGEMLGFRIYINTKEAKNEKPHVHLSTGKGPRGNDMKIWLESLEIGDSKGRFSEKELVDGLAVVRLNKPLLLKQYEEIHGAYQKRTPTVRKTKKTNKRTKPQTGRRS